MAVLYDALYIILIDILMFDDRFNHYFENANGFNHSQTYTIAQTLLMVIKYSQIIITGFEPHNFPGHEIFLVH